MQKVVNLEGVFKPLLAEKLGMVNLRYLNLRRTYLDSFPAFIEDLPRLEILDLKHTHITILPCSIWKANNLRHLYMNGISIQKPTNQPPTNLQVLTGLNIGSKDFGIYGLDRISAENSQMHFKTCQPSYLKVDINRSTQSAFKPRVESYERSSVSLKLIFGWSEEHHQIGKLPRNLKILTLWRSGLTKDPMKVLGKLPQLRMLWLSDGSYLGQKMTCHADQNFPELRVLKLWALEKLELLTVKNGAMPQLRKLEIGVCKKLRSSEGLYQLPALKELILTTMPQDFVGDARRRLGNEKLLIN
uniref:Disease resistance R13L4/SHOC-2-like LRR domain-containing protein n=1 Tax=Quercus lobata TaxID=97700 RepID=A0A7N2RBM8_QUELO